MSSALRRAFARHVRRAVRAAPLVEPFFLLEHGPGLHVVDLRPPDAATGVLGHVPGSVFLAPDAVEGALARAADRPLVLVDATGEDAAVLARDLETKGVASVAALDGGLTAWRRQGLGVSRDPRTVRRALAAREPPRAASRGHLTIDEVRAHVGHPGTVRWVQLAALAFHAHASCVDGRDERAVIGVPGGDAGRLVLALAAAETVRGRPYSEAEVHATLVAHLDTFNDFYLHTDRDALDRLGAALRADPRTAEAAVGREPHEDGDALFDRLRAPPEDARAALLEHLVEPVHLGCGHLRLMLEHPEAYGVRARLVAAVIRSFFRLLWEGAGELRPVVLEGGHAEGAVVEIRLAATPWQLTRVPVVAPRVGGVQMFVAHPDVARSLRRALVAFLCDPGLAHGVSAERAEALEEAMDALAARQLAETLGRLAKGLPVYQVRFARDGTFEVRDVQAT